MPALAPSASATQNLQLMSCPVRRLVLGFGAIGLLVSSVPVPGALAQWIPVTRDAENQAIAYSTTTPGDPVSVLQRTIDDGSARLSFDAGTGYLTSVLTALDVPAASQALVFSKTSFQRDAISASNPRALYFNSQVYVGWVPGAPMLEIASVDPALGAIFYTLRQEDAAHPRFERHTRTCLQCHDSSSLTGGVPGLLMTSVHTGEGGAQIVADGVHLTTDESPMKERWGGWFVTGRTGGQPHMGADLITPLESAAYPAGRQSDVVALTLLAHQARLQNLMTRTGYHTRMALFFDRQRNADLGRNGRDLLETTTQLIARVAEPLVEALLFSGESALAAPIAGTSGFADAFSRQGPRDRTGRSLFELDLRHRTMRYPCSYMIYSASFDALPAPVKTQIYRRLSEVLRGTDTRAAFSHLTTADRSAVLEILRDTKPEFVGYAR